MVTVMVVILSSDLIIVIDITDLFSNPFYEHTLTFDKEQPYIS